MINRISVALLGLILGAAPLRAQEFQPWSEVDVTASWRNIDLVAPFVVRVDPNNSKKLFAAAGLTADYGLRHGLTVTGGYLFVDLPGVPVQVNAPLVAASETLHFRRLTISDRNRFERLIGLGEFGVRAGLGASPWRYRNRPLVDLSLGRSGRWHAFADDEVFFDFAVGKWNENRLRAGGGARIGPRLFLDVYFLQQDTSRPDTEIQGVGSTLRVALTRRK